MTVGGVLLAAGGGSRFQGRCHKLLTPFRGRPLAAWSLDALVEAGFDHRAVVTGAVDLTPALDAIAEPVSVIPNANWADGQATSLQVALAWGRAHQLDAVVIGLADQPLVPGAVWRAVGDCSGAIVTAEFGGRRRPPVRLDRSIWHRLPATGDDGARTLMRAQPDLVTAVSCPGNAADIDTLEDLDQWS